MARLLVVLNVMSWTEYLSKLWFSFSFVLNRFHAIKNWAHSIRLSPSQCKPKAVPKQIIVITIKRTKMITVTMKKPDKVPKSFVSYEKPHPRGLYSWTSFVKKFSTCFLFCFFVNYPGNIWSNWFGCYFLSVTPNHCR